MRSEDPPNLSEIDMVADIPSRPGRLERSSVAFTSHLRIIGGVHNTEWVLFQDAPALLW